MPLAFQSLSHGEVAFGFFNIETDMMLLNDYFFFASDFCSCISELAGLKPFEPAHAGFSTYVLAEKDVGNLMGAINGFDFSGFIGETYKMFPFPKEPHLFKQNPEGYNSRQVIEDMVKKYASLTSTRLIADRYTDSFTMGPYIFSRGSFASLLDYVWFGGMPKWKDNMCPDYVLKMKEQVIHSVHPLFKGIDAFH